MPALGVRDNDMHRMITDKGSVHDTRPELQAPKTHGHRDKDGSANLWGDTRDVRVSITRRKTNGVSRRTIPCTAPGGMCVGRRVAVECGVVSDQRDRPTFLAGMR